MTERVSRRGTDPLTRSLQLAALAAIVFSSACGSSASTDDFAGSAVGVEANGCSLVSSLGSGAVMAEGRVITSAHTIAGAVDISVIDDAGATLPAVVVWFDPDSDLAVLAVPDLDAEPLAVGRASGGESGWVLAWNRNDGVHAKPMTVTKRILVTIEDIYVDDIIQRGALELAADIEHGDSGAAVITPDGAVVGIIYANSRSRVAGFALNEREITAALESAGTTPVDTGPCT